MILRRWTTASFSFSLLFLLISLISRSLAADPKKTITSFPNFPANIFFFDDSESAIYFDAIDGDVHVSQDEGKTWKLAESIPKGEVRYVIEHPFDNQLAFALTKDTKHYMTSDRGKTWRSFELPIAPAPVARPLSFHSDPKKYGYILYQGTACTRIGWGAICHDETFYTKDAFRDEPQKLLSETSRCQFAHSSKDFKHDAHDDLIYCVAFDTSSNTDSHSIASSRLFSSTDFFQKENKVEELGIGKNAKGVVAFAIVSKFAVVALRDITKSEGEMLLYVTVDTKEWAKAQFPHASSAQLRENAYTIVESTTHSLAIDVMLQDKGALGTLFVSNSNGIYFVQSLKDTNRNEMGFVDYERIYGVEGIGISNIVANADEVVGRGAEKKLKSMITFDDGSSWAPLRPPSKDLEGKRIFCDITDVENCSLHLHSVTNAHNFGRIFSSPAPGLVMGVGSIGATLRPYEDCDTFLSTDAGVTWTMAHLDAHKYEFGDAGSILVIVNDEDGIDFVNYSLDMGKSWKMYKFDQRLRARALVTVPDSTSQKFLLVGQVARKDQSNSIGPYVVVHLDFAETRERKCEDIDFEKWSARPHDSECLMGHKQWYKRRKPEARCYVGEKFKDPVEHEDDCDCTDRDYECDFNFIRSDNNCIPMGPEPIPADICVPGSKHTYMGSSGWRKIPGNTCKGGHKDDKVERDCSQAKPAEGEIIHQTFSFPAAIEQHAYFPTSTTILVRLADNSIWQSSNEGYSWRHLFPEEKFVAFYHHPHSPDRAYLITAGTKFYATTDSGGSWNPWQAPTPPNTFRAQVLRFTTVSDQLIWTGNKNCEGANCHAEAQYSSNNGRSWHMVEKYVVNCAWASDTKLKADPTEILCESYAKKEGNQRHFDADPNNPLELVEGQAFFAKKKKLFDRVVGFAKFSEYLVVAELLPARNSLDLQVSLDGVTFAAGMFPPSMHPETHAYTVLESSTDSLFLHMTMSEPPYPFWGTILKSNSNGTYFGVSIENVNRNDRGYVDFEKMIGLDGIAIVNVVADPAQAAISGRKALQSRITHNDGGTWKPLRPPLLDSNKNKYSCDSVKCVLNVHGYTERRDPRATYSSPGMVGLVMAVGNVGESLAAYTDSDTFLSRDGGFTWEEVHKDAHLWEVGDSGSLLIMANDEEATDRVLFSTDEGLNWREYTFSQDKIRVWYIVTVPEDTSRRFILFGQNARTKEWVAIHIDFSALVQRQCVLNVQNSLDDDFELWSPSEERAETCLFGRQTMYHRRLREANCVVGTQTKEDPVIKNNCACTAADFECEFNYYKNDEGKCVLQPGTTPLADDATCSSGESYWYSRTAYRKIPYSSCVDGERPDRGDRHECPGFAGHSGWFWFFILVIPFGITALVGYWYYHNSGMLRGNIRLPGDGRSRPRYNDGGIMGTIASVPWFLIGVAGIAWEWVVSTAEGFNIGRRRGYGYRNLPVDEDARILRFEDEE